MEGSLSQVKLSKFMIKSNLLTIIAIALLVTGALFYYFFEPEKIEVGPEEVVFIVNFGETKRFFVGETVEGMTVFDALSVSAEAGELDFNFEEGVLKRVGEFEENEKKWNLYLNRRKIEDDLSQVLIQTGDKIELRFE